MRHSTILVCLQNFTRRTVTQTEIAEVLKTSPQVINKRAKRDSQYPDEDIAKLVAHFGDFTQTNAFVEINNNNVANLNKPAGCTGDCRNCNNARILAQQVEINYLEELPESERLPEITSLHTDLELITNHWQRDPEKLRIIPMQGDNLSTYFYPCKNRDILIVDIGSRIPTREGIYVYSARDNTMLYVGKLYQSMDGSIRIEKFEANGDVTEKIVTPEKQKEVDFKILGRVVKNASLSL